MLCDNKNSYQTFKKELTKIYSLIQFCSKTKRWQTTRDHYFDFLLTKYKLFKINYWENES